MNYTIILVTLLSLFAKAQFLGKDFPYGCYFTHGDTEYLEYTCEFDGKSRRSCLNQWRIHQTEVKVIRYLCESKKMDSLNIYANVFNYYKNVSMLDTSYLGITSITPIRSESSVSANEMYRWLAIENQLKQIPNSILDWMPRIQEINFSNNKIHALNFKGLKKAREISTVNCSHNDIGTLEIGALSTLPNLEVLDISYNRIVRIGEDAFSNNKMLKVLNLANNPLTKFGSKLISSLHNLEKLDLSNTQIGHDNDGSFEDNPKIKELNLRGIPLKKFSFNTFSLQTGSVEVYLPTNSIQELDISCGNSICHFKQFHEDDDFKNIRIFKASGNRGQNMSKLLDKIGMNVTTLDLSQNSIEILKENLLDRFLFLQHLNLSHSNISKIEDNTFSRQSNLISLDLSNNNLKDFDKVTFSFNKTLKNLNLAGNHLTRLAKILPEYLPMLKSLEISNNPMNLLCLEEFLKRWNHTDVKIDVKIDACAATIKASTTNVTTTTNNNVPQNSKSDRPPSTDKSSAQLMYVVIGVVFIIISIVIIAAVVFYFCRRTNVKTAIVDLSTISTNVTTFTEEPPYEEIRDPMPSAYAVGIVHHIPHYENAPAHSTTLDQFYNASLHSNEYATVYHHYATISKPKIKRY